MAVYEAVLREANFGEWEYGEVCVLPELRGLVRGEVTEHGKGMLYKITEQDGYESYHIVWSTRR